MFTTIKTWLKRWKRDGEILGAIEKRRELFRARDAQILLNRIRTPDGTVLTSHNQHDYRTHEDDNGKHYMVDGGRDYLRRSANGDEVDLSVMLRDDHEQNRLAFHWGTRGPHGYLPLEYRSLAELGTKHIEAILKTQPQIRGTYVEVLMQKELEYRSG